MNHSIGENDIHDIPLSLDMIQGQFRNGKITAWMLPIVLVLSLFTFSGASTSASVKLHKAATEQIDLVRVSNKKCASFKIVGIDKTPAIGYSAISFLQVAICHALNVETQLKQSTSDCLEFVVFRPSLLQYPQRNSEEDFSISQIG
jgi:hypothetical protein